MGYSLDCEYPLSFYLHIHRHFALFAFYLPLFRAILLQLAFRRVLVRYKHARVYAYARNRVNFDNK